MKNLKDKFWKLSNLWPYIIILLLVTVFFWKFFLKGLIPLPADFVVGTYLPWLDYKWGYPAGVPVKNPITTDVPSFIFPMQQLAVNFLKSGHPPLWNKYILGGTPLLANFQSSPFSPFNFLYFIFNNLTAWSLEVILQHVLAAIFTYLLLRSWKVSKLGSILGGAVFAFSGFNLIWSEWNGHALSAAFIPLLILVESKWFEKGKVIWGILLTLTFALQIFSGYPQVVLYTIITLGIVWFFKIRKDFKFWIRSLLFILFIVLGIGIAAPQILPGAELLKYSQRKVEPHPFDWAFLPLRKTITFVAPDFFGNHSTYNYWGPQDYTSNTGFVGVVAGILALFSSLQIKKKKEVLFLLTITLTALVLAYPTPISIFLWKSDFLGFNAASAHRSLIIFNMGIAALAAVGFDGLDKKLEFKYKLLPFSVLFLLLGGFGIYAFSIHQVVGLRNLILPFAVFFTALFVIFVIPKFKFVLVFLSVLELFYFGWKFIPFSPRGIVFPDTPVITFLKSQQKPFRVVADKVIPINFLMNYGIETLEGYDAVYPENMSSFIAQINGSLGSANSIRRYGIIDNYESDLLDLANVKYLVIYRKDLANFLKNKKFKLAFEDKSVAVLENKNALPRAFMKYGKANSLDEVKYITYKDQESLLEVDAKDDGTLLVSDTFYPGWKAYIDGKETRISKSKYSFREINIPKGKHEVRMVYHPNSFYLGLKVSSASLLVLVGLMLYLRKKL